MYVLSIVLQFWPLRPFVLSLGPFGAWSLFWLVARPAISSFLLVLVNYYHQSNKKKPIMSNLIVKMHQIEIIKGWILALKRKKLIY